MAMAVKCPVCYGTGKVADNSTTTGPYRVCHGCGGKGWVIVRGKRVKEAK